MPAPTLMLPPVPALLTLAEKADMGDTAAAERALDLLSHYQAWQMFALFRNGEHVQFVWGRTAFAALAAALPSMLAEEYQCGLHHVPSSGWTDGDDVTLTRVDTIARATAHLGSVTRAAFVLGAWRHVMRARGLEVPMGFGAEAFGAAVMSARAVSST